MSRNSPFVGLMFDQQRVGSLDLVTTPPYDVITLAERRRFCDASPYNVIRLELGEDLPGDDEANNKYRRAGTDLRRWREEGTLVPTDGPAYFAYEIAKSGYGKGLWDRLRTISAEHVYGFATQEVNALFEADRRTKDPIFAVKAAMILARAPAP